MGKKKVQGSRPKAKGSKSKSKSKSKVQGAGGRPTRYDPVNAPKKAEVIRAAVEVGKEFGATDEELARRFGISPTTFDNWKLKWPDLRAAWQKGVDVLVTQKMEAGLYKRAEGYQIELCESRVREKVQEIELWEKKKTVSWIRQNKAEFKRFTRIAAAREFYDELIDKGLVVSETWKTIYFPPNPTCLIFALCNLAPERWHQKQEHRITAELPALTFIQKVAEKVAEVEN